MSNHIALIDALEDVSVELDGKPIQVTVSSMFSHNGAVMDALVQRLDQQARSIVADPQTSAGRRTLISTSATIRKSKAFLDKQGKTHTANLRAQVKEIDSIRRDMRERLDALAVEIRAPVTEWEKRKEREKRQFEERFDALTEQLKSLTTLPDDVTVDAINERINQVDGIVIDEDAFGQFSSAATAQRAMALSDLRIATRRVEAEAQRAAIEKARQAQEAKQRELEERQQEIARKEEEQRRAAEAEARLQRERQEAEARLQREREDANRRAAEAQKRLEAERQESEARLQRERAEAAKLAAAAEELARKQQEEAAERARVEQELVEAQRRAAETAPQKPVKAAPARKGSINTEIRDKLAAIMETHAEQATADIATEIVIAIARGQIPHLSIDYGEPD